MTGSILMRAILAMDAYNRGYNPGISGLLETSIGDANYLIDSTQTPSTSGGQAAGFYAVAYALADGTKVVSYRGTDETFVNPLGDVGGDLVNGYGLAIGSGFSAQSAMAIEFYKSIAAQSAAPNGPNVVLTGHSLGGGLAGLARSPHQKNEET